MFFTLSAISIATFRAELNVFPPKCCVFLLLSVTTAYFIFVPTEQELHHSGLYFPFPLTPYLHNMSKTIVTTKTKSTLRSSLTELKHLLLLICLRTWLLQISFLQMVLSFTGTNRLLRSISHWRYTFYKTCEK